MDNISINMEIQKLRDIEFCYESLLDDYRIKTGKKIVSSPVFFIPPEIFSAFNIVTLKIPEFILNSADLKNKAAALYNTVAVPGTRCACSRTISSVPDSYIFSTPLGFGEDAAVSLHNEISLMLKTLFDIEIKSINIESLQKETLAYEKLRRLIRSICAARGENRSLLDNSQLAQIFETALILPPEIAIEYISPVLEEMKKFPGTNNDSRLRGMIYGGKSIPSPIADDIEQSGILIVEDDTCTGRRVFDISLNASSEYIFYELLDAYSYRPLTPCMRPAGERYELLYKLLRNYNIDTVIFYRDETCVDSNRAIDYLRIRMMRDGIDPIVIDKNNYHEIVADYLRKCERLL